MEFHQVKYFLALCETLNFTKAAERCNVSQPSLTRAVRKLEEELGGSLVYRERSNTHLTELGRMMAPRLREILESAQSLKAVASAFHCQTIASIRLAVGLTVEPSLLADPLRQLTLAIPELEIKLERVSQANIEDALKAGDADMAIAGDLEMSWNRLDQWTLFSEGYSILVPECHDLAQRRSIRIEEISDLPVVSLGCQGLESLLFQIDSFGLSCARTGAGHFVSNENDLIAFVEAGLGLALLPSSFRTPSRVMKIPIMSNRLKRSVQIITVAGRRRSPACTALIKLLRAIDWPMRMEPQVA